MTEAHRGELQTVQQFRARRKSPAYPAGHVRLHRICRARSRISYPRQARCPMRVHGALAACWKGQESLGSSPWRGHVPRGTFQGQTDPARSLLNPNPPADACQGNAEQADHLFLLDARCSPGDRLVLAWRICAARAPRVSHQIMHTRQVWVLSSDCAEPVKTQARTSAQDRLLFLSWA